MNDFGVVLNPHTVRLERVLPGSAAEIWAYLTDPEKRSRWLASGPMELKVGGAVELRFDFKRLTNEAMPERFRSLENGHIQQGRVTQCNPPHLLSYTWNEKKDGVASEVRFELIPQGAKTTLIVTHSRLPNRNEMVMVSGGWHTHLGLLEDCLSQHEPRLFWATFLQREQDYQQRIPAEAGHTAG